MIFVTLNPLSIELARSWGLSSVLIVNLSIIVNMLNSIPFTLICIWLYARYPASKLLRIAMTVLLIGSICRAMCYKIDSFWTIIIGGYLCSCCNPFFVNVQSIIANKWFPDDERAFATALQTIAMPLGSGLSFGLNQYWFSDTSYDFLTLFKTLMVIQCGLCAMVWVVFQIII